MKQAFLIIAHDDFNQLKLLLSTIDNYNNDIFVHIDKRMKDLPLDELYSSVEKSNIEIIKMLNVNWGGYSLVECEMLLFETAFAKNKGYKYYHLISGADFPIKPMSDIETFFEASYPKNFIEFAKYKNELFQDVAGLICKISDDPDKDYLERISAFHLFHDISFFNRNDTILSLDNLMSKIQVKLGINRIKNNKIVFCKGSQWGSFTDEFVDYLLSKTTQSFIGKNFKYGICVDELYKQTILFNSSFKKTIHINNVGKISNVRKIDWKRGNPYTFQLSDFDDLSNDSQNYFARKFSYRSNPELTKKMVSYVKNN